MSLTYEDFFLSLEAAAHGRFRVKLLFGAKAQGEFAFPFPAAEMASFRSRLERSIRASILREGSWPRHLIPADATALVPLAPEEVGARLFQTVFPEEVRKRLGERLSAIGEHPERGLRIWIKTDPEDENLARLSQLPWEFLYHPDEQEFLAPDIRRPIVRSLDVRRHAAARLGKPPWRLLVATASPDGLVRLGAAEEVEKIRAVCGLPGPIEVKVLDHATRETLRPELKEGEGFDFLHFIGHGHFDVQTGGGALFFEDGEGGKDALGGEELARLIRDLRGRLRLVVLNACDTAAAGSNAGLNPFAGVATALVNQGLSAVVAMQFSISDAAAIAFSEAFYRQLARGGPVVEAMEEGRHGIRAANQGSLEWATPVLFMHTRDGKVIDPPPELATKRREAPRPERAPPRLLLLWSALLAALALAVILVLVMSRTGDEGVRIAVEDFDVLTPQTTDFELLWQKGVGAALREKLSQVEPGLRLLDTDPSQLTPERRRRLALDYTIRGHFVHAGQAELTAYLYDRKGVLEPPAITVRSDAAEDAARILALQTELVLRLLERLRVQIDPETESRIRRVPTDDAAAWELNAEGVELVEAEELSAAEQKFRAAIRRDAHYSVALSNLSFVLARQGRYEEALRNARAAAEQRPRYAVYQYNLGALFALLDRNEEALAALHGATRLDPTQFRAFNELGNVYLRLERWDDARQQLQAGLDVEPSFPLLPKNLARVALSQGKPQEALEFLAEAQRLTAEENRALRVEMLYLISKAHALLGDVPEVCRHLQELRRIDPQGSGPYGQAAVQLRSETGCDAKVSPATPPTPSRAPEADRGPVVGMLTQVEGTVTVATERVGRRAATAGIRRAQPFQNVAAAQVITLPAGARVGLICSNDRWIRLEGEATWTLTAAACLGGEPLPSGSFRNAVPKILVDDTGKILVRRPRSPGEPERPLLLAPRHTALTEDRPTIRWSRIEGTSEYVIALVGPTRFVLRLDRDEVDCTRVEAWSGTAICEHPWPAEEPGLTAGESYELSVGARLTTGSLLREEEDAAIHRLSTAEAQELSARLDAMENLNLDDASRKLLQAGTYAAAGLYAEAIPIYQRLSADRASARVRVLLGSSYQAVRLDGFARTSYAAALAESSEPGVRAVAEVGLGQLEFDEGAFAEARSHLETARDLFAAMGWHEQEETVAAALKRVPP